MGTIFLVYTYVGLSTITHAKNTYVKMRGQNYVSLAQL